MFWIYRLGANKHCKARAVFPQQNRRDCCLQEVLKKGQADYSIVVVFEKFDSKVELQQEVMTCVHIVLLSEHWLQMT